MADPIYDVAFSYHPTAHKETWFLFNPANGHTLKEGFDSKKDALNWALWTGYGWADGSGKPVPPSQRFREKATR